MGQGEQELGICGRPRAVPWTAPGGRWLGGAATGLSRIPQLPQGDVALRHAGALEPPGIGGNDWKWRCPDLGVPKEV